MIRPIEEQIKRYGFTPKRHWRSFHTDKPCSFNKLNWFLVESTFSPSQYDIEIEQKKLGFPIELHGSPQDIERDKVRAIFKTTWSCK